MGVVRRRDSPFFWLNLERGKGQRCKRQPTTIPHTTGNDEQDAENKRLANIAYHQAMADLAKGKLELPDAPVAPSTVPTLRAFMDDTYRDWLRREHPSSAEQAIGRIDRHFLPIFGDMPLDTISKADIERWRRKRRADKVSAHTVGRDLSDLRGLLSNAVELGELDASPLASLKTTAAPSREIIRYLDRYEERRLFAALEARDDLGIDARKRFNQWRAERKRQPVAVGHYKDSLTPMVIVALNTGARPSELFDLTWSMIDWHAKVLTIEWWVSKVRKTRRLPLNRDALTALKHWKEDVGEPKSDARIFPGKGGRRYTGAPKSWDDLLEVAQIQNFRFQDLRHTFASKLVQRGVNLYVVKDLMGHASIKTTERYAHLAPTQGRAAVNLLNKRR